MAAESTKPRCAQRHIQCHYTARPGETESQAIRRGYRDLRDRASEHDDVVALLRDLPDKEAAGVLRRIRTGTSLAAIIHQAKGGDVLMQIAVAPETRFRYSFPYRDEMPAGCRGGDNPYLGSVIYEVASVLGPPPPSPTSKASSPALLLALAASGDDRDGKTGERKPLVRERHLESPGALAGYDTAYLSPFHAARVFEPRLTDAKISSWTYVCDDDVLLRELLEIFFRCEYQFTSAFHKDYFLDDLAAGHTEFCSSLLVNLVLAYASSVLQVCNPKFSRRSEYWNPDTLAYRFLAEARRLWELAASEAHITTVQAGILFSVFYNLSGLDEVGQTYHIRSVDMADELGIMGAPIPEEPPRTQRGKAFTAWTFLIAFSFMKESLVKEVPKSPLPNPLEDPDWYGQLWARYPSSAALTSLTFGQVFEQKTYFRIIMNEFCQEAYATTLGVNSFKAEGLRRKLEHWYGNLPESLNPKNIVLPGQLQLHMSYYHILLSIYEPLLDAVAPYKYTPQDIVASSRKYLHTLIRIYFLRHGYEAMDLFIVIPLMVLADECLELMECGGSEAELEELRSTVILIAKGLHDQRRNHYLAEVLFRVLRGKVGRREKLLLRRALNLDVELAEEPQELAQPVRSGWPVSVVKKSEERAAKVLGNLVESYAHLSLDEEEDVPLEKQEVMD
ncbi:hypothetical protein PWT90_10560 [Aphanocladium album]|nr:hypothetical protein PWT90_10560 [Aphanocladium album]